MCQNRTETIKVAVLFRINISVTLINNDFWSFFLAALGASGLNLVTRRWFGYYQVPWISLLLAINMCSKLQHLIWTWLRFCIDCNVFKKILSLFGLNYHRSWSSKIFDKNSLSFHLWQIILVWFTNFQKITFIFFTYNQFKLFSILFFTQTYALIKKIWSTFICGTINFENFF